VRALKFLAAGATGRFSGVAWPRPCGDDPGEWLEADGPLEPCSSGLHACRSGRLVDWLDDELWEVELAGAVEELADVLLAERGRLLRQVEAWNPHCAAAFVRAVSARAADRVRDGDAGSLAADLPALAHGLRPDAEPPTGAVEPGATHGAVAANVAYVAAHAVALAASDPAAAFARERTWQDAWLADRLAL
jgi:hypothetical protein